MSKPPTRVHQDAWRKLGNLVGLMRLHTAYGVDPPPAWCKLLDKFETFEHDRALALLQREIVAGKYGEVPDLVDFERYLLRGRNAGCSTARDNRKNFWLSGALAQMSTAASMENLVGPRGSVSELLEPVFQRVRIRIGELALWAVNAEEGGLSPAEIDRYLGREADAFMRALRGELDAAAEA